MTGLIKVIFLVSIIITVAIPQLYGEENRYVNERIGLRIEGPNDWSMKADAKAEQQVNQGKNKLDDDLGKKIFPDKEAFEDKGMVNLLVIFRSMDASPCPAAAPTITIYEYNLPKSKTTMREYVNGEIETLKKIFKTFRVIGIDKGKLNGSPAVIMVGEGVAYFPIENNVWGDQEEKVTAFYFKKGNSIYCLIYMGAIKDLKKEQCERQITQAVNSFYLASAEDFEF